MNQKGLATIALVGIVIAVVAVVVVGVVVLVGTTPGGGAGEFSSLQCDFESTYGGTSSSGTLYIKDIGTPNMKVRAETTTMGQNVIMIINGETQEAWMYSMGTWTDISSMFSSYWDQYQSQAQTYTTQLSGWTGGDYTYTDPTSGATVTLSNIQINPSLDDSLFMHG